MSLLYVSEQGAVLSTKENRIVVTTKDGGTRSVPIETVEGITLLSPAQMTTQCTEACLKRGIQVAYFSKGGRYYGRLISTGHVSAPLQRMQSNLYETGFAMELSKKIIKAKIHNQRVVLARYAKSKGIDVHEYDRSMSFDEKDVLKSISANELMGHEGHAAKAYFGGLSVCIDPDFAFKGRNKRPPMDPFNSMISLGYSILMNELYFEIEMRKLNPYFGFLHKDAEAHPTLASDLMEEWRAVMIDSTVMSMMNGHEIGKDEFYYDLDEPGCYISRSGLGKYLSKLEHKFITEMRYLPYVDYPVSFRRAIGMQIERLAMAIRQQDSSLYMPIYIR